MAVRVDLVISLDGFATTTDQTPDNPFGQDWSRMVGAYVATRTFRERVFKDTSRKGTTGIDDAYAKDYFENIGAEIMGAGKFGLHNFPDDPNWKGWWGDEPPFGCPVFVLTHKRRPSIEMAGGTTFYFIETNPVDALQQATGFEASGHSGDPLRASAAYGKALLDIRINAAVRQIRAALPDRQASNQDPL